MQNWDLQREAIQRQELLNLEIEREELRKYYKEKIKNLKSTKSSVDEPINQNLRKEDPSIEKDGLSIEVEIKVSKKNTKETDKFF